MNLEQKIKEYLITLTNKCRGWVAEDVAHDIAVMCEIEIENAYYQLACDKLNDDTKLEIVNGLIKENTELKAKLAANRFIYNTFERHKYQDKISELEEKISIHEIKAVARNGRIMDLEQHYTKLEEAYNAKQRLVDVLYKQLAEIKYLNTTEVEKIFNVKLKCRVSWLDGKITIDDKSAEEIVTTICNLAIPENTVKQKIYKEGKLISEKTFIANETPISIKAGK